MNIQETHVLLTLAGLVDFRSSRLSADRAEAWADVLDDVGFEEARLALREHQRTSTDSVLPAHIIAIVNRDRRDVQRRRHDEQVRLELDVGDGVPMPDELREAFRADAKLARAKLRAMYARPIPVKDLTDDERAAKVAAAKAELDERRKVVNS